MGKTHLVIPDPHAHPEHDNRRAHLVGKLAAELQPDVIVEGGDTWDFPSLSSYDKGKKSFHGRSYKKDLDAGLDFHERMWYEIRKRKKKLPRAIWLEGNHEYRLHRALETHYQELEGVMSYADLDLERNYHDIVRYSGGLPGSIKVDGVHYAHFFPTGVSGLPIGGVNPANSLLAKRHVSSTAFHSHLLDFCRHTDGDGRDLYGLVAGVFQDYETGWAGKLLNNMWWRGVIVKRHVEDGTYNAQFITIEELEREYGDEVK